MNKGDGTAAGRTVRLSLLLGAAGVACGLALYALFPSGGKYWLGTSASALDQCAIEPEIAEKLEDGATGQMAAFTVAEKPAHVGELAFADGDGKRRTMADWTGRTVLLNLWATWCAPCRAEMPALEALNRELGGDTFEVVPVSVDLGDDSKPKAFYEEIGLKDLGFFHDADFAVLNDLKSQGLAYGLPTTLLIDRRGCVLGFLNGPAAWESDDAKALVRQAL